MRDSRSRPSGTGVRALPNQLVLVALALTLAAAGSLAWAFEDWLNIGRQRSLELWLGIMLGFLLLDALLLILRRNWTGHDSHPEEINKLLAGAEHAAQENRRQLEDERHGRELAETLGRVAVAMGETLELKRLLEIICQQSVRIFYADAAYLWLVDRRDLMGFAIQTAPGETPPDSQFPVADPQSIASEILSRKIPTLINDAAKSDLLGANLAGLFNIKSLLGIPLFKGDQALGALIIVDSSNEGHFQPTDLETAGLFGSYASIAIGNARLYDHAQRQVRYQESLRTIDQAITSNLELDDILQLVLQQVVSNLNVDAADILLVDPEKDLLVYKTGAGFRTYKIQHTRMSADEGYAGRAAREQTLIHIQDLKSAEPPFTRYNYVAEENFISYYAAPMISKQHTLGVLEVFHRTSLTSSEDWQNFLKMLAGQTVIAIENSQLVHDLQKANLELQRAYDTTIAGWGSALEMRDQETQGHTQRVTKISGDLARMMGLDEQQLMRIHRGSLLHDIGKMGIPDSILLKNGKLTSEETDLMQQHPGFAYQMLSRIEYLRDALDIPFCHHEHWDGSGYPRGLKGEQIPLAARVFAVADVFDALTSDRPYRKAWSRAEAVAHIQKGAGKQFDPVVVSAFMRLFSGSEEKTQSLA